MIRHSLHKLIFAIVESVQEKLEIKNKMSNGGNIVVDPKCQMLIDAKVSELMSLIIKQITRPDGILLIASILMQETDAQ